MRRDLEERLSELDQEAESGTLRLIPFAYEMFVREREMFFFKFCFRVLNTCIFCFFFFSPGVISLSATSSLSRDANDGKT